MIATSAILRMFRKSLRMRVSSIFMSAILLIASSATAWNPVVCMDSILTNESDVLVPVTRNSKLTNYLRSPALERWKKSSEPGFQRISDFIHSYNGSEADVLAFHANLFSFHGNMEISEKKALIVRVDAFAVYGPGSRSASREEINTAAQPRSLDTSFVNLMGAITDGVKRKLADDPSIQSVKIVGLEVRNRSLMKMFQNFGFTPDGFRFIKTRGKNWSLDFVVNRGAIKAQ